MGLFNKNFCIDCGKSVGLTDTRLSDDKYICMNCFFKLAAPMRQLFNVMMDASWMSSDSYKAYMAHKKEMELYWNQLRAADRNLKEKIDKITDNFYVCDEYGFYVVGPIPEDGSYSNNFDIYHVEDTRYEAFSDVAGKSEKHNDSVLLSVMLRNPIHSFTYMMEKNASMEIGTRFKFDFYDKYNYKTAVSSQTEICAARVGRMRNIAKMRPLREHPDHSQSYDRDYERAMGLFMLKEDQPYGVAYLDQVRDTLTKVHGVKAEIDQAYEILLKHMGDGSGENKTEQNVFRFCPRCGTENPDGARFCENCGKELI